MAFDITQSYDVVADACGNKYYQQGGSLYSSSFPYATTTQVACNPPTASGSGKVYSASVVLTTDGIPSVAFNTWTDLQYDTPVDDVDSIVTDLLHFVAPSDAQWVCFDKASEMGVNGVGHYTYYIAVVDQYGLVVGMLGTSNSNSANPQFTFTSGMIPCRGGDSFKLQLFCVGSDGAGAAGTFTGTIDNGSGLAGTVLTITGVGAGIVEPGQFITGTLISANTQITGITTGTGGLGTYTVNNSQLIPSTTITATGSAITAGTADFFGVNCKFSTAMLHGSKTMFRSIGHRSTMQVLTSGAGLRLICNVVDVDELGILTGSNNIFTYPAGYSEFQVLAYSQQPWNATAFSGSIKITPPASAIGNDYGGGINFAAEGQSVNLPCMSAFAPMLPGATASGKTQTVVGTAPGAVLDIGTCIHVYGWK